MCERRLGLFYRPLSKALAVGVSLTESAAGPRAATRHTQHNTDAALRISKCIAICDLRHVETVIVSSAIRRRFLFSFSALAGSAAVCFWAVIQYIHVCTFRRFYLLLLFRRFVRSSLLCWPRGCRFQCDVPVSLTQRWPWSWRVGIRCSWNRWPAFICTAQWFPGFSSHFTWLCAFPFAGYCPWPDIDFSWRRRTIGFLSAALLAAAMSISVCGPDHSGGDKRRSPSAELNRSIRCVISGNDWDRAAN